MHAGSNETDSFPLSVEELRCQAAVSIIRLVRCHHNIALTVELHRYSTQSDGSNCVKIALQELAHTIYY